MGNNDFAMYGVGYQKTRLIIQELTKMLQMMMQRI